MLIPALGELTYRLDTDASGIAWLLTGYLVAAAVSTPVAGRLGDMFGKRRLLVISLVIFGAGSTIAALGSSLEQVVAGRVLQGFGGGIFPLCFGIIRDEFSPEKVAGGIGLISAVFGIGGGAGLIGGGVIADHLSYHWIFWLGTISAALAAIAIEVWVPESPERKPGRVDLRGGALLALGLVMPLVAISRANDWGWGSTRTLGLIAAGLVVLAVWTAVERRTDQPLAVGAAVTALGLVGLGLDHGTRLAVTAWACVMSVGIGLAFAVMANLVVEAVPPVQMGEASGINTLVRSVGASLGSQVSAAILAGSAVAGSPLATDGGFTAAFLVSAGVAALAAVIAVLIPRGEHRAIRARAGRSEPALAER